jgi:threonine dehydratase
LSGASGLPYRIRVPLAKLQERKNLPKHEHRAPALGDGEQLETMGSAPDYVRLALTSRVYDLVQETPLQFAPGLSHRLGAQVHIKREDLLPAFSYKVRGAFNVLDSILRDGASSVVTYSVGGQGYAVAVAAAALGMKATVVMPERTPRQRRMQVERAGATVIIHGSGLEDAKDEAQRVARSSAGQTIFCHLHDDVRVIAGNATVGLEIVRQHSVALETGISDKKKRKVPDGLKPEILRGAAQASDPLPSPRAPRHSYVPVSPRICLCPSPARLLRERSVPTSFVYPRSLEVEQTAPKLCFAEMEGLHSRFLSAKIE